MTRPTQTHVWVLFKTDPPDGIILCGTVYERSDADHWSRGSPKKGAILLPLGGLAEGEEW